MSEPDCERRWPAEGKAARNKRRDLTAGAASNIAVALLLASVLQPVLAIVQQQRSFRLAETVASTILFSLAVLMFVVAQLIAGRVED